MSGVRWMLALIALLAVAAGGVVIVQRVDRDRQYRRLLAEGEQALQTGSTYTAIEDFSGALALRPDSMVAYYRRGEAYHVDHHDDWAIRDLREASRLAPDSAQPLVALGNVYDGRNDPLEAARWYGEAADRLRDADPALLYALALARYRAGSPRAAIEPLTRAIQRNDSVGQTYYLLGLVYRDTSRIQNAIEALQQAIKVAPSLAPAREELADLYRSESRPLDEMAVLQDLAALDRNDDRQVAIAMAAERRGQYDTALAALGDVSAAGRDLPQVALARARILLNRSERTFDPQWARQAQVLLEQTLTGGGLRSQTLALLGRAQFLSGDPAASERSLTDAIAVSPVAPEAFEYLADTAERLTHTAAARDALISLDALEGDTASSAVRSARMRRIGILALKAGNPQQAADYLEQCIASGDSDLSTLGVLAEAYWQSGKTSEAKSTLALGLGRDPHNADLQRLSRTIK